MGTVWKTLISLGLVLCAIIGAAVLASRFLKKTRFGPSGEKVLNLVDAIPLGPKKQVYIVSAYGRKLVLGATQDRIELLSEFNADEFGIKGESPDFEGALMRSAGPNPNYSSLEEIA